MFDLLLSGSSLSTALMLKRDSITATRVMDNANPKNSILNNFPKSGLGIEPNKFSGSKIIKSGLKGLGLLSTNS